MKAKNLSVFTKMVKLAKEQNLEYKILYSHYFFDKVHTNGKDQTYKLILCTNLFTVTYEENFIPENTNAIKDFIMDNEKSCIELDFKLKINSDNSIELL